MAFILKLLVSGLGVLISARLLAGVTVRNYLHAILTAALIGVFNAVLKPILVILTIPITILTLGLFLLVINALLLMLVDKLLSGFSIKNFWWALVFSLVLSVINAVLHWILL